MVGLNPTLYNVDGVFTPKSETTSSFNAITVSTKWVLATGGPLVLSTPAIADLDGDGSQETIVGSHDDNIYCIDGSGNLVWAFTTSDDIQSSPVAVDLDFDGTLEVLVGSKDNNLYCLSHTGAKEWNFTANNWIRSSPTVADLNYDGLLEILIVSDEAEPKIVSNAANCVFPTSPQAKSKGCCVSKLVSRAISMTWLELSLSTLTTGVLSPANTPP